MSYKKVERDIRLDFIRCIAIISVISVHFLFNSGFYQTPLKGERMFLMTIWRTFFLPCVPLFLMLSGYLVHNKQINKNYYFGILHILKLYLISSIACIIFKITYWKHEITIFQMIRSILDFSAIPYAWYINFYIGLFLFIPFFNIMYNNLSSKKEKIYLVGTCIALTILPSLNIRYVIFPNWWTGVWPLTYYFIGAYFSEYPLKIKKSIVAVLILFCIFGFSLLNFYLGYNANFVEQGYTSYCGFQCLVIAILIFTFGLNTEFNNTPKLICRALTSLSKLSLGVYLASWIIDTIIYDKLNRIVDFYYRINYAPIIILIIVIGSGILSYFYSIIINILDRLFIYIVNHRIV